MTGFIMADTDKSTALFMGGCSKKSFHNQQDMIY